MRFRPVPLLLLLGVAIITYPFIEGVWKKYNPIAGAWPKGVIRYYNASEYDTSLREAFRRWEDTGIPLRFRETSSRSAADLVVYSGFRGLRERCSNCSGWATIGYSPWRQAQMWLLPPSHPFEDRVQDFVMMATIIHEAGHVLGLFHNDEPCSVMNSRDSACRVLSRPRITGEGRSMMCGPWERDLDNLRELYAEVGDSFSGWCHDRRADWDFFYKNGNEIVEALRRFQREERIWNGSQR